MKQIPYVVIFKRKDGTDSEHEEVMSYPFPDIDFDTMYNQCIIQIEWLRNQISKIENRHTREAQLTRLSFILDRWHVGQFAKISIKEWRW